MVVPWISDSTIVDLTDEIPTILRPGYINEKMLSEVLGQVRMDPGILGVDKNVRPKAPGMRYKHYAPKGDLTIVEGDRDKVVLKINACVKADLAAGFKVGVIATEETKALYDCDTILTVGERKNEDTIAHNLYGILRDFDELGIEKMYTESFDTPRIGQAIMNRLLKAAGHHVIEA